MLTFALVFGAVTLGQDVTGTPQLAFTPEEKELFKRFRENIEREPEPCATDQEASQVARAILRANASMETVRDHLGAPHTEAKLEGRGICQGLRYNETQAGIIFQDMPVLRYLYKPDGFVGLEFDPQGNPVGAVGPFPPLGVRTEPYRGSRTIRFSGAPNLLVTYPLRRFLASTRSSKPVSTA